MGNTVQVGRDMTVYYQTGAKIVNLGHHAFASGITVGLVNNLSYTVEHNVEVYHGAGKREGWGIKAGALDVTAHLDGLWLDSGAHQFFIDESAKSGALLAFAIGFSGSDKGVVFSGCRMGTFDVTISSDGWVTDGIDITALLVM